MRTCLGAEPGLTDAVFAIATHHDEDDAVLAAMRKLVKQEPQWLRCFVRHVAGSTACCVQLLRSNVSWAIAGVGPCTDSEAARRLSYGVARLATRRDGAGRPVIVLSFDALRGMLAAGHSLDHVASAHVWWLKDLLLRGGGAPHGVSLVQDLRSMSVADVTSFATPSALLTQLNYARLLTAAFPCEYGALVILDAPVAFGMLWAAVRPVLPAGIAARVSFCSREASGREGAAAAGAAYDATLDVAQVAAALEAAPRPSA
uniref:CRAL-TRIO domain-containing protein n=1 Tax=Calcidiscus leptoporus TaxID=127549 RepID=A0A7S0IR62_9EUKA|mmetsp:Transcript_17938/g.41110  ORF Transcript_17938/g.41110 Transcript_17938/m.41110 type:complete len:259 (+) Transcript_17938:28-804(+)